MNRGQGRQNDGHDGWVQKVVGLAADAGLGVLGFVEEKLQLSLSFADPIGETISA